MMDLSDFGVDRYEQDGNGREFGTGAMENLVHIYHTKLKGRKVPEKTHDGSVGHWLESQFGVAANRDDSADWEGFELKTGKSKTTFGDWSADMYLWHGSPSEVPTRDVFLQIFGTQSRPDRPGRYSWSGKVFPTTKGYNDYGQIMVVEQSLDITIYYNYSRDLRPDKSEIVPSGLQVDDLVLAVWHKSTLENRVSRKFGQRGWVKFTQKKGVIDGMIIGPPITYQKWIEHVKTGEIYLDSGMYYDPNKPNNRPYANWRASNNFWDGLATDYF